MFLGHLILTALIMSVLLLYIRMFHPGEFNKFNRLVFILMLVLVTSFAVFRVETFNSISIYLLPFAVVPIIIKNFYQPGIALFTHLVIVLIASFLSSLGYEFTFLTIVAGIVAVLSPTGPRDWSKILRSMGLLALTYVLGYLGLELIKEGNWRAIDWSVLTWLGLNVFLTLLAYPLVPLLGRLFGFTSEVVLLELSDVNRPALRELALRAPGTLQHSLAVSNLAEAAVREIGGDTLLVKVAALYHDIGKTVEPQYFIENQSGRNPHEDLTALESAQVIINHIPEGVRLAKKYGLPAILIDFIKTHHGTTRVEYFYRTYVKNNPDKEVDEHAFMYPGPLPKSKEEAILMIADSVEAAGRAMKDHKPEDMDALVDNIIEGKIKEGQLSECSMTFAELQKVRELFKTMLRSMYHARVIYPEEEE
jgi:putative nucleotidyltransferase with HDIG domain